MILSCTVKGSLCIERDISIVICEYLLLRLIIKLFNLYCIYIGLNIQMLLDDQENVSEKIFQK